MGTGLALTDGGIVTSFKVEGTEVFGVADGILVAVFIGLAVVVPVFKGEEEGEVVFIGNPVGFVHV